MKQEHKFHRVNRWLSTTHCDNNRSYLKPTQSQCQTFLSAYCPSLMVSFSCLRVNTTMMHILRVAGHTRGEWDRVTSLWYQWLWFAYQNLLRTTQTAVLVGRNAQYDGLVHKTLDFNQWNARHCGVRCMQPCQSTNACAEQDWVNRLW